MAPSSSTLLAIGLVIVLTTLILGRLLRARRLRRRFARASAAERDAVVLARRAGYRVLDTQVQGKARLWVDGVRLLDESRGKRDKLSRELLALDAGLHPIRVEYVTRRRPNGVIFTVKDASADRALPPSAFWHRR